MDRKGLGGDDDEDDDDDEMMDEPLIDDSMKNKMEACNDFKRWQWE